jgi:hypothetical protein
VAVTVLRTPLLVLDADDVVVDVGEPALAEFGHLLGQSVWDAFPGSEPFFRPYYETARRTGEPVEFVQFYEGRLGRLHVVPHDGLLDVSWEILTTIDTLTLDGLRASVDEAISAIECLELAARREVTRSSLRVVPGGG